MSVCLSLKNVIAWTKKIFFIIWKDWEIPLLFFPDSFLQPWVSLDRWEKLWWLLEPAPPPRCLIKENYRTYSKCFISFQWKVLLTWRAWLIRYQKIWSKKCKGFLFYYSIMLILLSPPHKGQAKQVMLMCVEKGLTYPSLIIQFPALQISTFVFYSWFFKTKIYRLIQGYPTIPTLARLWLGWCAGLRMGIASSQSGHWYSSIYFSPSPPLSSQFYHELLFHPGLKD